MPETPDSINQWAQSVFGPATDPHRMVERAKEEFKELEASLDMQEDPETWAGEAADVCIVLMRAIGAWGYPAIIDKKMAVNRARSWIPDGTGHGYHVKANSPALPNWSPSEGPWCLKKWIPLNEENPRVQACLRAEGHEGECRGIDGIARTFKNAARVG